MTAAVAPSGLEQVRGLYDGVKADQTFVDSQPATDDPTLVTSVTGALNAEARLLDRRQFSDWLDLWEDDAVFWVPIDAGTHPGEDQSFFLDDRRRLGERVWRMTDKSAWGIWPPPHLTRLVAGVEAWPDRERPTEAVAGSAILIHHVRREHIWQMAGRQIHRLRRVDNRWRICRKILMFPALGTGTPNLGWLL